MLKGLYVLLGSLIFFAGPAASANDSKGFGLNVGLGVPFLSQTGINYFISDKISFNVNYNLLDLTIGDAKLKLPMPELMANYYLFGEAFYLGLGVGQESLTVSSLAVNTTDKIEIKVDAMTAIARAGWMWGKSNGGLWFGIDFSFISPTSSKSTITAPGVPTTDINYIDALESADKFGETAYNNITFARLGWIF